MSSLKDQLRLIPGRNEFFFFIYSDKLAENIDYIIKERVENIALNPVHGFKLNNIDFFCELSHVKKVEMGGCYDINFDGLKYLNNLEFLSFNALKGQSADLSNLTKLNYLSFHYNKNITGFNDLPNLENLAVSNATPDFFVTDIFQSESNLKLLSIVKAKLPESLKFLQKLTHLFHLELHYINSTIDISSFSGHLNALTVLKISHCKNVRSISDIKRLKTLQVFSLIDSVALENAKFVDYLPNLEILIVLGKSYFVDGDLSNLKGKLKHVSIDNKRHYNMKYEDLKGI